MNEDSKKTIRLIAGIFLGYFAVFTLIASLKAWQFLQEETDPNERQIIHWMIALVVISLLPFVVLNFGIFKSRDADGWDWGKLAAIFFLGICPSFWLLTKLF